MPPDFLQGLLHGIESAVVAFRQEFPKLMDKDVEFVYDKMMAYYTAKSLGKNVSEPEVTSQLKQDLIDEILNVIDLREELKVDEVSINNQEVTSGGKMIMSLAHLYVMGFKNLSKSARFWRKKEGRQGYLNYVQRFV